MAGLSIDNPFLTNPLWWGQQVLPTVEPFAIYPGGSMAFCFPAPPPTSALTNTVWECTIHVVERRGGTDIITPRVIPSNATNGLYTGILTPDETQDLEPGKYYFLVAVFTSVDKSIQEFVRFQVRDGWIGEEP